MKIFTLEFSDIVAVHAEGIKSGGGTLKDGGGILSGGGGIEKSGGGGNEKSLKGHFVAQNSDIGVLFRALLLRTNLGIINLI